jgi:hypothetical protein
MGKSWIEKRSIRRKNKQALRELQFRSAQWKYKGHIKKSLVEKYSDIRRRCQWEKRTVMDQPKRGGTDA